MAENSAPHLPPEVALASEKLVRGMGLVQSTAVNMLDWAGAYRFQPARVLLAAIGIPTLVIWGENSHPAARRANQLVAQCTGASVMMLRGASHFMITTHAAEVARALAQHVTEYAGADLRLSA